MIGETLADLRFGWRTLLRTPGFAFVAIVTLAPAIGANSAVFSGRAIFSWLATAGDPVRLAARLAPVEALRRE